MTDIINNCMNTSTVPSEWKTSRIYPIPKVKNPQSISDYRPISILQILSKVFERVILQQLTEIIEGEIIYDQQQSGFRTGHSTTVILLKLKEDIVKAMKKGEVTPAILADFSKAFDPVDYRTLLAELHAIGFSIAISLFYIIILECKESRNGEIRIKFFYGDTKYID